MYQLLHNCGIIALFRERFRKMAGLPQPLDYMPQQLPLLTIVWIESFSYVSMIGRFTVPINTSASLRDLVAALYEQVSTP
jgi:hypothetical protein